MGHPDCIHPTHRKERDGWGTRTVYIPPIAKNAMDGAPVLYTSHPSQRTRWMGHPYCIHPTHRKERDGWGTRTVYIPPIAKNAMDGAPGLYTSHPSQRTRWMGTRVVADGEALRRIWAGRWRWRRRWGRRGWSSSRCWGSRGGQGGLWRRARRLFRWRL